jgi:hypothetical protein
LTRNRNIARVFAPLLAPARYKGAYGGRGSGKSHFFGEQLVEDALCHRGLLAVCIREVQKTLAQSSKRLIEHKIKSLGVGREFKIFKDLMMNAAQLAPSLANQDYSDLQNALMAGGAYDSQAQNQINDLLTRWQYQQQQPWNLLDNYSGLITGLGGMGGTVTSNEKTKQPGQSLLPSLIGAGASLLAAPGTGGLSLFANLLDQK